MIKEIYSEYIKYMLPIHAQKEQKQPRYKQTLLKIYFT